MQLSNPRAVPASNPPRTLFTSSRDCHRPIPRFAFTCTTGLARVQAAGGGKQTSLLQPRRLLLPGQSG